MVNIKFSENQSSQN